MRLTIAKNPAPPKHTNTFVLTITFMSGDADAYETEEYCLPEDKATAAAEFLTALDSHAAKLSYNDAVYLRRRESEWRDLPSSWVIVDDDSNDHDESEDDGEGKSFIEWGYDSTNYDFASLDSWDIAWYDDAGRRFAVTIEP